MVALVAALSVVWALIPGAALFTIGILPVAVGFFVFMLGDLRKREGPNYDLE